MFYDEQTEELFSEELINLIQEGKYEEVLQQIISDDTVDYLIDIDGTRTYVLHLASKYNNLKLIRHLTQANCELNAQDSSGRTALTIALIHENFEALEILFEAHIEKLTKQLTKPNFRQSQISELKKTIRNSLRDEIVTMAKDMRLSSKKIGQLLAKLWAYLSEVVIYQDATMTNAYLEFSKIDAWQPDKVMAIVMPTCNLHHIQVLTNCGLGWQVRCTEFFRAVLNYNCEFYRTDRGKVFLDKIFSWQIFGDKHLELLEKQLTEASDEGVRLFLQFGLHTIAKLKYNRDVFACLFGNRNIKVTSLLENMIIDVNGCGYHENRPIHFAIENELVDNVQYLLDRGANPNLLNRQQQTPLGLAMFKYENENIVKLLLLAGANPLEPFKDSNSLSPSINYKFERYSMDIAKIIESVEYQVAISQVIGLSDENPMNIYEKLLACRSNSDDKERCNQENKWNERIARQNSPAPLRVLKKSIGTIAKKIYK